MTLISKTWHSVDAVWASEDAVVFFWITAERCPSVGFHGVEQLVEELPAGLRNNVCMVFVVPMDELGQKGRYLVEIPGVQFWGYPHYVYYFDFGDSDAM